jgi:hypothetical protein
MGCTRGFGGLGFRVQGLVFRASQVTRFIQTADAQIGQEMTKHWKNSASGPMLFDRAVRNEANAAQIWERCASSRTA